MEKESKSTGRDISGWCALFLVQLVFFAITLTRSFISNFICQNYVIGISETVTQLGIVCDIISVVFIDIYAILVIYSFIKRLSYSVQLAMSYVFALFLNANGNLIVAILSYNSNTHYLLSCILGIIWFSIWLIFLYYSRQIEELFPISARVSRKKNYLPIIFIGIPHILLVIFILGYYL